MELEIVAVGGGSHFITGKTFGQNGAFIPIFMAQDTTEADLPKDCVLTHEMVHLAFPLGFGGSWYRGCPRDSPSQATAGWIELTHGAAYWGGALFCVVADLQIREGTADKYGLQDALRRHFCRRKH